MVAFIFAVIVFLFFSTEILNPGGKGRTRASKTSLEVFDTKAIISWRNCADSYDNNINNDSYESFK